MQIIGVFTAAVTASDIESMASDDLLTEASVRPIRVISVQPVEGVGALSVTFESCQHSIITGRTEDGSLVVISLGKAAERATKYPTIIASVHRR